MERVKEKLKTENSVQKEIANYLISHCKKEPALMDKIMNEKKSLNECFEYIKSEAKKHAVGNAAVIDRDTVFGWAVHYFDEDNLKFERTSADVNSIPIKKTQSRKKGNRFNVKKENKSLGEQLSLFEI